ncbi:IclR family transcriptional regulator [Pseudaestuariivita rosea]|uniref:IclR family transcriptional regulator n=1 Tax=Pseudaestuariivita rosea TaxID=2763263 RepID=UPI001ABAEC29|nr:IclR family transcriptional regulator [Pseudaestuariivita rosea]
MTTAQPGDGTVGKALQVLDQVAGFGRPVRFGELLEGSEFPKATLYRFVQTLTNQGMLMFDPDRQTYALGVRLVRLAHAAWQQSSLAPIARPHLDALSRDVGETVHLAQIDNAHVLYVDKRNAAVPIEMYSQAGKIGPAYCTGVGKVMLAYLAEDELQKILPLQAFHQFTPTTLTNETDLRAELQNIRSNGYGFDREEHEPGIICVAVPILSARGRLLGALSVTSSTDRSSLATLERWVPKIRQTADMIADEVQTWRFPDQTEMETRG